VHFGQISGQKTAMNAPGQFHVAVNLLIRLLESLIDLAGFNCSPGQSGVHVLHTKQRLHLTNPVFRIQRPGQTDIRARVQPTRIQRGDGLKAKPNDRDIVFTEFDSPAATNCLGGGSGLGMDFDDNQLTSCYFGGVDSRQAHNRNRKAGLLQHGSNIVTGGIADEQDPGHWRGTHYGISLG
jgi:hypothetical protein